MPFWEILRSICGGGTPRIPAGFQPHWPRDLPPRRRSSYGHVAAAPGPLPRFLLLYTLIYAAYGIEGPFMPALLAERGMSAEMIGVLLAVGTGARLLAAPLASSVADRFGSPRAVLGVALLASALFGCGFAVVGGFAGLMFVSILVAMALAPVNPLADALVSREAGRVSSGAPATGRGRGFSYGVVRGTGSAAFVGAAMVAGPVVAGAGLETIVWANAGLLLLAAVAAVAVLPRRDPDDAGRPLAPRERARPDAGAMLQLLAMAPFRRLLLLTGLVQGSHALYGAFATLHWQAAGIAPETIGVLWSVAVASEVAVFFVIGPWLLGRFGPAGLAMLAAGAGVLRWAAMASISAVEVQFLLQPLHGLTFAALHLATMRLLAEAIPPRLSATAFGVQASLGPGLAGALLTLAAGPLYESFGAGGFWAMAALCAIALPIAARLAVREEDGGLEGSSASPVPAFPPEEDLRPAIATH